MLFKIRNTNQLKSMLTFTPVFKCTNTVDLSRHVVKQVLLKVGETKEVFLEIACDNNQENSVLLKNINVTFHPFTLF
jgi:hypothetical protein